MAGGKRPQPAWRVSPPAPFLSLAMLTLFPHKFLHLAHLLKTCAFFDF